MTRVPQIISYIYRLLMKKFLIPIAVFTVGVTVLGIHPAAAATNTPAQIIAKSDTAITARITSLNTLSAKIAAFKHLTAAEHASLTATIQSSIIAMNALKAKIDNETDLVLLKSDYASIMKDYRVYMVVMPSTSDIAATDTALATITTYQSTLATLQTRITTANTAGENATTVQAAHDNAITKLIDAQTQGQTMITAVTSLKPDMGDKTVEVSNKAAVAAAKTARKAMSADLSAVKKDIATIRSGLKTLKA